MELGEIIRNYRLEHKLSQRQFAEQCGGVTNGYISMIEQGKNPSTGKPIIPSIDKLSIIAHGMGMSLHQLIAMADDSPVYLGTDEEIIAESAKVEKKIPSKEWKLLSEGFEEFEKTKKSEFMMVFNMLSKSYPEFFGERNDADDTES